MNPYEPPASSPQRPFSWWLRLFRKRPSPFAEQQRLLDDFAHAIHQTRMQLVLNQPSVGKVKRSVDRVKRKLQFRNSWLPPRFKRKINKSLSLDDQFSPFSREQYWHMFWTFVDCPSPVSQKGLSISEAVQHIVDSGRLGDRVPPGDVTVQQWVNAQVFAGVQLITIEQYGVSKEGVYRSAHFIKDLDCC